MTDYWKNEQDAARTRLHVLGYETAETVEGGPEDPVRIYRLRAWRGPERVEIDVMFSLFEIERVLFPEVVVGQRLTSAWWELVAEVRKN